MTVHCCHKCLDVVGEALARHVLGQRWMLQMESARCEQCRAAHSGCVQQCKSSRCFSSVVGGGTHTMARRASTCCAACFTHIKGPAVFPGSILSRSYS